MYIDFQLQMFELKTSPGHYNFAMQCLDDGGHIIAEKIVEDQNTRVGLGLFSAFRLRCQRQFGGVPADSDDNDYRQDELPF